MTFLYHEQTSCWLMCDMSLHKSTLPPLSIWIVDVKVNLSFDRTDKTITFYNILIFPPNWTYILDLDADLLRYNISLIGQILKMNKIKVWKGQKKSLPEVLKNGFKKVYFRTLSFHSGGGAWRGWDIFHTFL